MPLSHEVGLDGAARCFVVLNRPILPDSINHRLAVFFCYNHIGDIANQIAELLIGQPRFVAIPRYLDDFTGQHHKKAFGVFRFTSNRLFLTLYYTWHEKDQIVPMRQKFFEIF